MKDLNIQAARQALKRGLALNDKTGIGSRPRVTAWLRREHSAGRITSSQSFPTWDKPIQWFWLPEA